MFTYGDWESMGTGEERSAEKSGGRRKKGARDVRGGGFMEDRDAYKVKGWKGIYGE